MANLGFQFDASRVQPAEAGSAVWEGVVPMVIERTEVSDTAAKNGNKMLVLHVKAVAGEYNGQSNVVRLNLWNQNPQAAEVAQRQLSSICHCTGRMQIQDSDQLIGGALLGIWAKEEREITDQQTGMPKKIPSCQCKDFKLPDGRTIKEAVAGQPASQPYSPGTPAPSAQSAGQGMSQQTQLPAGAPGFQPGGAPALQGAPQTGTAGFAPGGGYAPAPNGGAPGPAAPGISTAGSPFNPGSAPPAAPGGGFAPSGGAPTPGPSFAPGGAPSGFPQPQAPGGFPQQQPQAAPQQYQPGPGAQYDPNAQPPFPGAQPGAAQPGPWGR